VALTKWRADRCMAPGCGVPASRCQIDHSLAWEHGGETSVVNTAPLCQGHHTVKHHGGWRVIQTGDGSLLWISPSGRQYIVAPERRLPVFRVDSAAA
ncbi:MAG TPA: HNH endonuclease, partial [Microbacterium sp.]|nr:HNH endonuclease [Microbacterium sp.]